MTALRERAVVGVDLRLAGRAGDAGFVIGGLHMPGAANFAKIASQVAHASGVNSAVMGTLPLRRCLPADTQRLR